MQVIFKVLSFMWTKYDKVKEKNRKEYKQKSTILGKNDEKWEKKREESLRIRKKAVPLHREIRKHNHLSIIFKTKRCI